MKLTARKQALRASLLALALLLVLLMLLQSRGKRRIVFPPEISTQVLQQVQPEDVDLLVKKSAVGVNSYVCRYTLQPDGTAELTDPKCWQSSVQTIDNSLYRRLRCMDAEGRLLQVQQLPTGWLTLFGRDGQRQRTVVETDSSGKELFRYVFDGSAYTAPAITAITDGETIYVLSYQHLDDRLYITSVNKATGQEHTVSFSYAQLSGDPCSQNHMGGFLYDGSKVRVADDVLYLAATCYSETDGAVVAAWNMAEEKTEYFQRMEGGQIMSSYWIPGGVQVLLNHKAYSPLELRTIHFSGEEPDTSVQMPLPQEFTQNPLEPERYYLFESQVTRQYTAVLYPDQMNTPVQPDEQRRMVLAVYSNADGSLISRTALQMPSRYDIYEIRLHEPPMALQPFPANA